MAKVQDILAMKGPQIYTIRARDSVLQAIQRMNEHKIGALVVTHEDQVVGMFTERDVLQRVIPHDVAPAVMTVDEVMSSEVICVRPDTNIDDASSIMKNRRVRHLPVCDEHGALLGLISIGDLNGWRASDQEQTIYFLNEYIYGRV